MSGPTMRPFSLCLTFVLLQAGTLAAQPRPTPIAPGEALEVTSELLGETRPVHVAVPPSYEAGQQRYPVLYVLDGEMAFPHTTSAARFLARLGQIPDLIVVGIPNTDRLRDMPVPDGYGRGGEDRFLAFLADELVPLIDARYRTQPLRLLSGHSQGGLFALYALATHPASFRWVLALDAPLLGRAEPLKDQLYDLARQPGTTGRLVTVERTLGWGADWERLAAVEAPRFRRHRIEVSPEAETHETMTYTGTYAGLRALFADYPRDDLTTKTRAMLEAEYTALSAEYGYDLPISKHLLLRNVDDLLFQARADDAEDLLAYYTARYGPSEATTDYARRLDEVRRDGPLDETVTDILAYPPPDAAALQPYLGTWTGRLFASEGHGVPVGMTVVFEMRADALVSHTTLTFPDGLPRQLDNVMVRVLPDGALEWGYMNQTRPRGVLVTHGRLTPAGTFEGTQEMRGVRMKLPPGMAMPVWYVELTRTAPR